MPRTTLRFDSILFYYESQSHSLFENLSFTSGPGWTGIVGANGLGKTTLLSLATGGCEPLSGSVIAPQTSILCEQRTDRLPRSLAAMLSYPDAEAGKLTSILQLEPGYLSRWETLSHGERKRSQIGAALWQCPELLALDEPTNHLDMEAISVLSEALRLYRGIGLIVSHDRYLLDSLCHQCLFLSPHKKPVVRPGGVSAGLVEEAREFEERRRIYQLVAGEAARLIREQTRRREKASRQNARRSRRGLRWKDSDAREKIGRARLTGADGNAGRSLNQIRGRVARTRSALESMDLPPTKRTGITVSGHRSRRDTVIARDPVALSLGPERSLRVPALTVLPDEHIGLVGTNGSGKSTLVNHLVSSLGRGQLEETLYIPQELPVQDTTRLAQKVRQLDHASLGRVLSTVSRLGSQPEWILETDMPSPGEARKLMLALGLERDPTLILMDEPTNHLDIVSIDCLQRALAEFPGALLLVSHDRAFLSALVTRYWVTKQQTGAVILDFAEGT